MNRELKEKITNMIEDAVENELRYAKDYITNDGWSFLEDKATELVLNKIEKDYYDDDEIENITSSDIESYLNDVICEYEEHNPPIRVNSLWK